MSIPLDRLYHYIENVAEEIYGDNVIIYRFWPHGSKNIENLTLTRPETWSGAVVKPTIYCADQEPLNFDFYQQQEKNIQHDKPFNRILKSLNIEEPQYDTNFKVKNPWNRFDKAILLHSEQQSQEIVKYANNGFVPVYYWSHAVIAKDWFRFAQYLSQKKQVNKTFLAYNRAWSGSREYRLKFAELLIKFELHTHCQMSISAIEPELEVHYDYHKFENSQWRPDCVLENYFPLSQAKSYYSADFDIEDYENTDIEIVLETLFDDQRIHLTEKILRPIACGQPFILTGTAGSLKYLKRYGFQTFDEIWPEEYDNITNSQDRLNLIVSLMRVIADWDPPTRARKMAQARAIAEHNRQHFFSQQFDNFIKQELIQNFKTGFIDLQNSANSKKWLDWWDFLLTHQPVKDFLKNNTNPGMATQTGYEYVRRLLS